MIPKQFLVDDMGNQLGNVTAGLLDLRKRITATQKALEAQRKRIDALRKRVDRQALKRAAQP